MKIKRDWSNVSRKHVLSGGFNDIAVQEATRLLVLLE